MAEVTIVLHCPHCQQAYQMDAAQVAGYTGRSITCRRCQQPFDFNTAARAAGAVDPGEVGREAEQAEQAVEQQAVHAQWAQPPAAAPQPPAPAPPAPPAPVHYATAVAAPARPGAWNFGDLITFRSFALVPLVRVLFWAGAVYYVFTGLMSVVQGVRLLSHTDNFFSETFGELPFGDLYRQNAVSAIFSGCFTMLIGPLVVRVLCEVAVVVYRMYECMRRAGELRD